VVQHHNLCDGDGMTLITFEDGKVVLRNGAVATEQACCCEAEKLPARCSCNLFSSCTTTIEYDGLVIGFQSSTAVDSALYQKNAGSHVYDGNIGTGLITTGLRQLFYLACGNRTSFNNSLNNTNALTVCSSLTTTTVDHHFVIAFVPHQLTGFGGYAATFLAKVFAYTYDLGTPEGESCPGSLEGKTVTVQKVAELDNGCNSSCSDWLEGLKDDYLGQPVTTNFNAFKYDEFLWNPDVPPATTAQTDDAWVCAHELWTTPDEPEVSIVCAP
jgi:hypothetical protein